MIKTVFSKIASIVVIGIFLWLIASYLEVVIFNLSPVEHTYSHWNYFMFFMKFFSHSI